MTEAAGYGPGMTSSVKAQGCPNAGGGRHPCHRRQRRDADEPRVVPRGPVVRQGVQAGPGDKTVWTEADKTGFGTARTRAKQRLVHAAAGTDQRGVLPRPLHAERAQPRAAGHRRDASPTARRRTCAPHEPARPAQPAVHAGEHAKRASTGSRGASSPTRAVTRSRQGAARVAGRRQLPAVRALRPGARQQRDGRHAAGQRRCAGRHPTADDRHRAGSKPAFGGTSNGFLGEQRRLDRPEGRLATSTSTATGRARQRRPGRTDRGVTGKRGAQRPRSSWASETEPQARRTAERLARQAGCGRPRPLRPRLARATSTVAEGRAGQRGRRTGRVPRLGAGARGRRGQAATPAPFVASPSAPWVWGDEVPDLSLAVRRLPPGVVARRLRVRHRAVGDGRPGRRAADRGLAVRGPAEGRTARSRRTPTSRHAGVGRAAARRGGAADRARPAGRPQRRRDLARRAQGGRFLVGFRDEETGRRAPYSPQERWENQSGYSPNSIAAQISGLVVRRRHGARATAQGPRAEVAERSPTAGSARSKRLDGHAQRAAERRAVLPAADQERQAEHAVRRTRWATAARR